MQPHPPGGDKVSATQLLLRENVQPAMGFKCDVCEAQEGSVFCFGDNAVMCEQCDVRCGSGAWFDGLTYNSSPGVRLPPP